MQDLRVDVFDLNQKPSCANDEPNVVLPGYAILSEGNLQVPQDYDLVDNAIVKVTAFSESGTQYCSSGKSVQWYLPDYFCVFNLCEIIGKEMCSVLGRSGTHTIQELVDKINFNPKLKLPSPPCFLGLVCLTEIFGGKYHVELALDYKNQTILHWKMPMDRKFLQISGDTNEDDDEEDEEVSSDD